MANGWLNKSIDENNRTVLTASEKDTDGQAVTRVKFKEPPLVQLSGRNVDKVTFLNAEQIRDTANHTSALIDLSAYKEVNFLAVSSLDKDVDLLFAVDGSSTVVYDGTAWNNDVERTATLPTTFANKIFMLNTKLDWLNKPIKSISITAKCLSVPTTGAVTVYVWGVKN